MSEGVLAMRTYALYNRTRWISYVLGGIWVVRLVDVHLVFTLKPAQCTVLPALAISGVELASLECTYEPVYFATFVLLSSPLFSP